MTENTQSAVNTLVGELVQHLGDDANAESARSFPRDAARAERPGLYAWWVDDEGRSILETSIGGNLSALIYAGQAGATSARSLTERSATLRSRITGNHLNGNIGSSTFRKTLTALLKEPLDLRVAGARKLDIASNAKVSAWMRDHLQVATVPVDDRGTLLAIEEGVLRRLNPPLNLMGMAPSPERRRLSALRAILGSLDGNEHTKEKNASKLPPESITPASSGHSSSLTLHEAMVEGLRDRGWLTFTELAQEIRNRDLYRKRNGGFADASQLRLRSTQSGGRYSHLFEVTGDRIRLADGLRGSD
jgi:hypothetical protein